MSSRCATTSRASWKRMAATVRRSSLSTASTGDSFDETYHPRLVKPSAEEGSMRGFKNFLMQGDLIVIAVGLSIALAFSTLIASFTTAVITPLVNAAGGSGADGLGFHVNGQFVDFGAVISAIVYFIIFVAVIYFAIVVPY